MNENSIIYELKLEKKIKIPIFREKWQEFILSTERINQQKVIETIKSIYFIIGEREPEFFFGVSPNAILEYLLKREYILTRSTHLGRRIEKRFRKPLRRQVENYLSRELIEEIYFDLIPSNFFLQDSLSGYIKDKLKFRKFISNSYWFDLAVLLDFSLSTLLLTCDKEKVELIQSMAENCGCILPYSGLCLICDRPTIISFSSFDDGKYIHAEGKPAIQFSDGFSIYVNHGELVEPY